MPTTFVKGDLFELRGVDAIAHGCNCAGAMGKGIAVDFRKRFPEMYIEYRERCLRGLFKIGDVFAWTNADITVFNLGTQKTWRTKANLSSVKTALEAMIQLAETKGVRRVGMPRIGAGLGGLEWQEVRAVLVALGESTPVELVVVEEFH